MKWVPDKTGRFTRRPHYHPDELDTECEAIIEALLVERQGAVRYPVTTEDLLFLLERRAAVDQFADLESDIWGVSFFPNGRHPQVQLSRQLSCDSRYENPFRTTIAHEFGHVHYHRFLYELPDEQSLFPNNGGEKANRCYREGIERPAEYDWIEWQAAYCSGALMMPKTALASVVRDFLRERHISVPKLGLQSAPGQELVAKVAASFRVSTLAAQVRLSKLGHLTGSADGQGILLT